MPERHTDLVISGGGLGGCAAALSACRAGLRVVMTEETDWIGGQLTQQAVPPDEHPWIESFGGTRSYRDLRARIRAEFTVLEQHVGTDARMALTGQSRDSVQAEHFFDSVGLGSYRIDLHPSTGGDNYIDISSLPFQIPLGSLIPRRIRNLIAGAKNLGVTHITNGCYRLHPVEWNIGESAGALAAFCLRRKAVPTQVRNAPDRLRDFQKEIESQGIETAWPRVTPR